MADLARIARDGLELARKATPPHQQSATALWCDDIQEEHTGIEWRNVPDGFGKFRIGEFTRDCDASLYFHAINNYAALCAAVIAAEKARDDALEEAAKVADDTAAELRCSVNNCEMLGDLALVTPTSHMLELQRERADEIAAAIRARSNGSEGK